MMKKAPRAVIKNLEINHGNRRDALQSHAQEKKHALPSSSRYRPSIRAFFMRILTHYHAATAGATVLRAEARANRYQTIHAGAIQRKAREWSSTWKPI